MKRAIELALLGTETGVNPRVGCVLVRNGKIIGEGFHARCGGPHAERAALDDARANGTFAHGATVYVTLEPCSHFGRTPPCAPLLVENCVERVVIGMTDPNPKVNGAGFEILKNAGIEVELIGGELEAECKWINRGFIRAKTRFRPWITIKAAVSLDGMMALADGTSKWLTGAEARAVAHELRAEHDGILVGVGTILADDPELTVRLAEGKSPRRVILDTHLKTPPSAKAVSGATIFCATADGRKKDSLESAGARVIVVSEENQHVSLREALKFLAEDGIQRLLVEGGATVHSSMLAGGFADAAAVFVAPKFLGAGINFTRGLRFDRMSDVPALENVRTRRLGNDTLIEGLLTQEH